MKVQFIAVGSTGEEYLVEFTKRKDGEVEAFCTCAAADNYQACKHRLAIIQGKPQEINLLNGWEADARKVAAWLPGTKLLAAVEDLARLQAERDEIDSKLKAHKKLVRVIMDGGA